MSAEPARPGILYLSRDGVLDGLGESQILGYLRALAGRYRFRLMTFEKHSEGAGALRAALAGDGIVWTARRFHPRRSVGRVLLGLVGSVREAARAIGGGGIDAIHARGYLPCAVALAARRLARRRTPVVFDMRGFWIDERAESGQWRSGGWLYRLGRRLERRLLRGADAIVTLNAAAAREASRRRALDVTSRGGTIVVPTCVDTERFRPPADDRWPAALGTEWRHRLVFVYSGAAGYWQAPDTLARFFASVRGERADAGFLCLARTGGDEMRRALERAGVAAVSFVAERVPAAELPVWLGVASLGVVWYRPTFSRIGNFPTKLGEYLACGLPVIVAGATADSAELVMRERVGVVLRDDSPAAEREAIAEALLLLKDPDVAERCRRTAERELSLAVGARRYDELYQKLIGDREDR